MEMAGQGIRPSVARALQPGEVAPDFALPAVNRDGVVSLADFRGQRAVLVGLFRGFDCPFCRRQITQLGVAHDKLRAVGVDTLAIIATPAPRAALYVRYRPTPVILLSDSDFATHRAFGLPKVEVVLGVRGGGGEGPPMAGERGDSEGAGTQPMVVHGNQLAGHFLIDRTGIIRWAHVEGIERAGGTSHFPGEQELLQAARGLTV